MTEKASNSLIASPTRIRRTTESIINLPTLPTVVSRLIDLVENPKTSAATLARLIESDQTLTARVLKLANSAYYGFSRKIASVNMAIVVMGFNTVKDVGLSMSVFSMFDPDKKSSYFDLHGFWQHSIAVGTAAKLLARKAGADYVAESFVAGLLHDIGKVILQQYFTKEFHTIMQRVFAEHEQLEQAELSVAGATHGQIGGWLADKWKLPQRITSSMKFHHDPVNESLSMQQKSWCSLIALADFLAYKAGFSTAGRLTAPELSPQTWHVLEKIHPGFTPDVQDDLIADLYDALGEGHRIPDEREVVEQLWFFLNTGRAA